MLVYHVIKQIVDDNFVLCCTDAFCSYSLSDCILRLTILELHFHIVGPLSAFWWLLLLALLDDWILRWLKLKLGGTFTDFVYVLIAVAVGLIFACNKIHSCNRIDSEVVIEGINFLLLVFGLWQPLALGVRRQWGEVEVERNECVYFLYLGGWLHRLNWVMWYLLLELYQLNPRKKPNLLGLFRVFLDEHC